MRMEIDTSSSFDLAGTTAETKVYDVKHQYICGVHYFAGTTTAAGKIDVMASCDGVNFFVHDTANISASGAVINAGFKNAAFSFPFMKVLYTRTSGSGTLTVHVCTKGF